MELAGERLKQIRLEKGISLEDAAKATKIHLGVLEALEEGRLINKAPVYIKGFLKIYCEFLGINPEDYVTDQKKPQVSQEQVQTQEKPVAAESAGQPAVFKFPPQMMRIIIIVVLLFAVLGLVNLLNRGCSARLKRKQALSQSVEKLTLDTIRLTIRARENCWIKAKVDGKVTYVDILKKGRFESWQAKEKIELSLGNAGGIELQLNGKLISPLGRKGQVIKQIEITKTEGLKIIR